MASRDPVNAVSVLKSLRPSRCQPKCAPSISLSIAQHLHMIASGLRCECSQIRKDEVPCGWKWKLHTVRRSTDQRPLSSPDGNRASIFSMTSGVVRLFPSDHRGSVLARFSLVECGGSKSKSRSDSAIDRADRLRSLLD